MDLVVVWMCARVGAAWLTSTLRIRTTRVPREGLCRPDRDLDVRQVEDRSDAILRLPKGTGLKTPDHDPVWKPLRLDPITDQKIAGGGSFLAVRTSFT
ncbi:MAG: hypothetical protein QM729_09420 [Solirubrobacterales bacterium]